MARKKLIKPGIRILPYADTKILRKGANVIFKSVLAPFEANDPFHVINEYQYRDFHRNKYVRNRMLFPLNIPTHFRINFNHKLYKRDVRKKRALLNIAGRPNWGIASGNQLLLSLNQVEKYGEEELIEILYRLSIHPEIGQVDLPNNDLLRKLPSHVEKMHSGLKFKPLLQIFLYMSGMGYRDQPVMGKLAKNLLSKLIKFNDADKLYPGWYAEFFLICMRCEWPERLGLPEMRDVLIEQVPRYLSKMPENMVSLLFEYCVEEGIIATNRDHLFDAHFLQHIWKRPYFFKPESYLRNFDCLIKLDYILEDPELMEEELLPHLGKTFHNCEDVGLMHRMLKTVDQLLEFNVAVGSVTDAKDMLFRRILFVETKLKMVKNSDFAAIVNNDLKYYKLLHKERKEERLREQEGRTSDLGVHSSEISLASAQI